MPRYYIDVRSHFSVNEDPSGLDLPDIDAARAEALKIVEKLLTGWAALPENYLSDIVVEIVGEDFRPVLTIPCADIWPRLSE